MGKQFEYELYPVSSPASRLISDRKMTLEEMQKFVGGYIEVLSFKDYCLIFNEEGRLKKLKMNSMFRGLVGNVIKTKDF